jgi:hypothetical protein
LTVPLKASRALFGDYFPSNFRYFQEFSRYAIHLVKLPKFAGETRGFDVRKKRFRAFGLLQRWAPALLENDAATAQQHLDLYSTLVLALLEDNLSLIESVSEIDKNSGLKAWIAVVDRYEDNGIYRLAESRCKIWRRPMRTLIHVSSI